MFLLINQTARVAVTNEGVVPTRFTVTTATTTYTAGSSSPTPPGPSPAHPGDGKDANPAAAAAAALDRHREDVQEGVPRGETDPRTASDGGSAEAELLERACAVGDAGMKYPEGKGAIEVVGGGGELAGYGSGEIVVVFAPLTVGDFRTVKVGFNMMYIHMR